MDPDETEPCGQFIRVAEADCLHCGLRRSALFADLGNAELGQVSTEICSGVLRRGSVIYSTGDTGASVFTVRVGLVKLVLEIPGREERIVRLLGRGATLGLEVLAGRSYDHTATTLRTTSLCRIATPTVESLHERNPRLLNGLMAKWHEQVMWADRWIAVLGSGAMPQRLANLVRLLVDIGGDPLDAVNLPSIADIAAILGASQEAVSRHLAEFKRTGVLTHVAPRTYRCDSAAIMAMANGEASRPFRSNGHASAGTLGIAGMPWGQAPNACGLHP